MGIVEKSMTAGLIRGLTSRRPRAALVCYTPHSPHGHFPHVPQFASTQEILRRRFSHVLLSVG